MSRPEGTPKKVLQLRSVLAPSPVELKDAETQTDDIRAGPSRLTEVSFKTPFQILMDEFGAGLTAFYKRVRGRLGLIPDQSVDEEEELPWVCVHSYFPLGEDREMMIQQINDIPPHLTHLESNSIGDILCFEFSTRRLQMVAPELLAHLGTCVRFEIPMFAPCVPSCRGCGILRCVVCPHQFSCDCKTKVSYEGVKWCAHIHVAQRRNMGVYGKEACLFIQNNYTNLTEKRHIRAMVQGPSMMSEVRPNVYMENFEYLERSMRYHVRSNTSKIPESGCKCEDAKKCSHCRACWCRYSCTCEDYWYDRQVCEHIHSVAMLQQSGKVGLDKQFKYQHFKPSEKIFNEELTSWQQHRSYFIDQEHEKSFYIPFVLIKEVEVNRKWELMPTNETRTVTVLSNPLLITSCICKAEGTTRTAMCMRCKICKYHYICKCEWAKDIGICRHMHAVEQFVKDERNESETFDEKLAHFEAFFSEFEMRSRSFEKMAKRKPVRPKESQSADNLTF